MSYAFDDYEAFLASFAERDNLQHNPSLSTTLSTDEDLNAVYPDYNQLPLQQQQQQQAQQQQQQQQQQFNNSIVSPDFTSSSSSPNQFAGNYDFEFNAAPYGINSASFIKQESISSSASSSASPTSIDVYANTNVSASAVPHTKSTRLADAVPHNGSISKRAAKKEKSSHNMIEKRYRTNINDKIKALRDSVPALRVLVESGDDDMDDLDGLTPAKKLNKATILSKATEYIKHLEAKNELLKKENDQLKARLYGGQITPESSVSSYSGAADARDGMSLGHKVLLGGLACVVGSNLTDDFSSADTRSLFALPVFSYDSAGLQVVTKPVVVMSKLVLIFAVLLNVIFPSLLSSKSKKKQQVATHTSTMYDDVRELSTASLWSTLSLKSGHSNTDYVTSAIYRAILIKTRYAHANLILKTLTDIYVDHLWTYLKSIKLDSNTPEHTYLKSILSLDNSQTINNVEYLEKFMKYDITLLKNEDEDAEADYSVVSILYHMINESRTNMFLKQFMVDSVTTDKTIPEIENSLASETDEYNVELTTLFNPNEDQIEKFKTVLESWELSTIKQDDILVLYSSIIQNLVFEKRDFASAKKWFAKLETSEFTNFNLLGFTSLYIAVLSMISHPETYTNDKDVIFKIEEMSALLRIWLGNATGSVLAFKKRSQLIDFFVNISLKINGMDGVRDLNRNEVMSA